MRHSLDLSPYLEMQRTVTTTCPPFLTSTVDLKNIYVNFCQYQKKKKNSLLIKIKFCVIARTAPFIFTL